MTPSTRAKLASAAAALDAARHEDLIDPVYQTALALLAVLKGGDWISTVEISTVSGLPERTVQDYLQALSKGLPRLESKSGPGRGWRLNNAEL